MGFHAVSFAVYCLGLPVILPFRNEALTPLLSTNRAGAETAESCHSTVFPGYDNVTNGTYAPGRIPSTIPRNIPLFQRGERRMLTPA